MNAETYCRPQGVLPESFPSLFGRISKKDYRHAVALAIFNAKTIHLARHKTPLTNEHLAELLGVDEKTVRNAEDESNGCLDPVTMLNLAVFFGEDCIRPVRALYLGGGTIEELTVADRLNRIERDTAAIRQEIAN